MDNATLGKHIMIIGSCGSGKTTLAIELGKRIKLPVIHLDKEYWHAGWVESSKEKWIEKQWELLAGECWIVDGNYGGSLDIRLGKADTAIFLDYSRYLCLYRVLKRWITNIGRTRIDMADGCVEKIDVPFIRFVWRFPFDSRPKLLDKLQEYTTVQVIRISSPKEARKLIEECGAGIGRGIDSGLFDT